MQYFATARHGALPGDGIWLACHEWPGAGAPVVALHGITATSMSFVGVAAELDGSAALLALDLRGHGDSDKPAHGYGIEQHARDVARAMRARGLSRRPIIGHSFGAYVATALAVHDPDLVSELVFVDGGYPPLPPGVAARAFADAAMQAPLVRARTRLADAAAWTAMWRALPGLAGAHRPWLDAFAAYDAVVDREGARAKVAEAAVRAAYDEMVDVAAVAARLEALRVPVFIVRAEHGAATGIPPIMPADVVATMRRRLAACAVRTVDGSNHFTIVLGRDGARLIARTIEELA